MLSDRFFEEYSKTGPPVDAGHSVDTGNQTTYSAADVEEIVNKKLADALAKIGQGNKPEEIPAITIDNEPEESPAESED